MRRPVWLAIAIGFAVLLLAVWLYSRRGSPDLQPTFPLPALSESPYLNTGSDAGYVGVAVCKVCHAGNHDSYLHTAHSRALSEVDPAAEPSDGSFHHKQSGRSYRVYRQGNQFRHEEVVRTSEGKEIARQDLPIRYLVGSGHFARTYLAEVDGFLYESPITWYTQKKQWAMSPGYDSPVHPGFERAVTVDCLVCHAGRVARQTGTSEGVLISERAIGCESCHGPGSLHVDYQRTKKHVPGDDDLTIVNPGKLSRPLLESICAACHLQGVAYADVRGRDITDFRPGRPLSDYRVHYRFDSKSDQMNVVGHFEQLWQSACYQKSEGMSCLTCHNPHLRKPPPDLAAYHRQQCLSCHADRGCALAPAERLKKQPTDSCVTCHMPRGDTDIPHIAFTHHRIGRHPAPRPPDSWSLPGLVPIEAPGRQSEIDRRRNLGLAYLMTAFRYPDRERAGAYNRKARDLLESVYEAGLRDGATLQHLAKLHRRESNLAQAALFAHEVLAVKDAPVDAQVDAMQAIAEDLLTNGKVEQALVYLEKLTRTRRAADDWRILGATYLRQKQPEKALHALQQALAIHPFDYRNHAGLAEALGRLGNEARAREHADKALRLERQGR